MARTRLRLRRLALVLAALLAAQGAMTLALRLPSLHARLRARLERAFGRPVTVGYFGLSVWSGLRLEAHYITVGEDPQFGYEFVLRADRLSAAPRWRALLGGRLEFSRYSFERPSLNLVRAPDGRWNFVAWAAPPPAVRGSPGAPRVDRVSISSGRINFKRGADKLPFALVDVNGQISPAPDGRWKISLDAQPFRAGVTLQDAGTLRFAGTLPVAAMSAAGGAVSALPAEFSLEWSNASLSDALRLVSENDYGVRGSLEGSLTGRFSRIPPAASAAPGAGRSGSRKEPAPDGAARSAPPAWKITGTLRLSDVHRWDLPLQPGPPAVNLTVDAVGSADRRDWELRQIVVEARRSSLRGTASFRLGQDARASLRVLSASIHLDDLLIWYRAFHPGVRPGASLDGYLGADVELRGWPVRIVHATLATTGAKLNIPGERRPIELRRSVLEADSRGARLVDLQVAAGDDDAGLRLAGRAHWAPGFPFEASLTGGTAHLAAFSNAVAALGLSAAAHPLRVAGSATARLTWTGMARPWRVSTTGTMALENLGLSGGLLRSDIAVGRARLDFLPGRRRLQFAATKAFGSTWSGTLGAPSLAGPWEFSLVADRLNPALLVGGFSSTPPDDTSFLSRILPAQAAATLAVEAPRWPGWLRGEGALAAGTLSVGRLQFERVKGHLSVGEREVAFEGAQAGLAGGRVRGEVRADFGEQPRYAVRLDFEGVSVAPLAGLTTPTRGCCTGSGSGHLELMAAGWTRAALLASLAGTGRAEVRSGALLTLDLPDSLDSGTLRHGQSALRDVLAEYSFSSGRARIDRLRVELPESALEGKGSVNYHGEMDLAFSAREPRAKPASRSGRARADSVHFTGTLAAPQIFSAPPSP
jgi:AsmA-like C-terminal region